MDCSLIADDLAIESQSRDRLRRIESQHVICIKQLTTTAPQLQQEVIYRIVPVRICRKGRAVDAALWPMKKARDLMELFPSSGNSEWTSIHRLIRLPLCDVLEQILSYQQTFRPIMIRDTIHSVAHSLHA